MFRRSGSFVAFHVEGRMPAPRSADFAGAMASQRFRSIEDAASEEASVGWVTPGDPTGDTFELEDLDLDRALWLRIRIDRKRLPAVWLRIRRGQAERSAGRKLSAAERRELKDALMDELLPRVLPAVQLVDVLYDPEQRLALLFGTATGLRDEFRKLWFRTFASDVVESDAGSLARRVGLDAAAERYLDEVSPVPWLRDRRAAAAVRGPRRMVAAGAAAAADDDESAERTAEEAQA
ncbi:MAG: recombination-associated protein RdgC [Planctomycetes bacterium]|nr:recombination-associated protein RdgC [Planctomycetota bacterium]